MSSPLKSCFAAMTATEAQAVFVYLDGSRGAVSELIDEIMSLHGEALIASGTVSTVSVEKIAVPGSRGPRKDAMRRGALKAARAGLRAMADLTDDECVAARDIDIANPHRARHVVSGMIAERFKISRSDAYLAVRRGGRVFRARIDHAAILAILARFAGTDDPDEPVKPD